MLFANTENDLINVKWVRFYFYLSSQTVACGGAEKNWYVQTSCLLPSDHIFASYIKHLGAKPRVHSHKWPLAAALAVNVCSLAKRSAHVFTQNFACAFLYSLQSLMCLSSIKTSNVVLPLFQQYVTLCIQIQTLEYQLAVACSISRVFPIVLHQVFLQHWCAFVT